MNRFKKILLAAALPATFGLQSCYQNPATGRRALNIVPDATLMSLANDEYRTFLSQHKVVKGTTQAAMVSRVGNKLAAAITEYYAKKGQSSFLQGFNWEFNLVDDPQKNAFCMPGGKVVVYTGILPVTQDENGLAVVMSHEIAHAIAKHGNERMSQVLVAQGLGTALDLALSNRSAETRNVFNGLYGAGAQVGVLLPNSRNQESEADVMGLDYMAMAGYNPQAAIPFWQRMASGGGAKPPEFLSTHPSDNTRIKRIQNHLPTAMKIYNSRPKAG